MIKNQNKPPIFAIVAYKHCLSVVSTFLRDTPFKNTPIIMAIIDLVRWAPQGNFTIYAYRFPETNLSTYTQLIVAESQEAVLFSKGQLMGKFGPGKHTLNTENLPILRSLFGIPFGGKNPFTAEIWFVNKIQVFNIDWHAGNIKNHDAEYNAMVPIYAAGQYGLRITDTEKFIIKFVGTRDTFTEADMTEQSRGEFMSKVKSALISFMRQNDIGIKSIAAFQDQLSGYLREQMNAFWEDLGLELTKFYINEIDIDDSTPEGERARQAIAQQSAMSITGHTWQQEQMFDTANNAIGSISGGMGGDNSLLGGIMAINMMNGMMGGGSQRGGAAPVGQSMMNPQFEQPRFGPASAPNFGAQQAQGAPQGHAPQDNSVKMVYCSNCGKKYPNTSRFCPNCGNEYRPCPKCGTDNNPHARRCVSCGTQLGAASGGSGQTCPACNAPLAPGSAFCGNCGQRVVSSDTCLRCGATLPPNVKFCPKCGNKRS